MAKAYSYDLRQKVINAIQLDGMRKSEAAQVFGISRNTINLWLKRQEANGDYQAKPTCPHQTPCKIMALREYVRTHFKGGIDSITKAFNFTPPLSHPIFGAQTTNAQSCSSQHSAYCTFAFTALDCLDRFGAKVVTVRSRHRDN